MKLATMNVEVSAAINLIATSLYNNLPRRRVDEFAEEIEKGIAQKFQGHWYPENPSKGAAYRCINVSGSNIDPLILYAAFNSNLTIQEVTQYMPKDLTIWIDPGEVSFSVGEKGQVRVLYSERRATTPAPGGIAISLSTLDDNPLSGSQLSAFTSLSSAVTSIPSVSAALSSPDELTSNLSSSLGSLSLSSGGSGNSGASSSWGTTPSPIPWPTTSNNNSLWSPVFPQKSAGFLAWNGESSFNPISVSQPSFLGSSLNSVVGSSNPTVSSLNHAAGNLNHIGGNQHPLAGNPNSIIGNPNPIVGNPNSLTGNPNSLSVNPNSIIGNPNSVIGNSNPVAGNINSPLGNPNSVVGNPVMENSVASSNRPSSSGSGGGTNNNKTMTAAMFAQTKFGSTKLKNHTKRTNRLSPTDGFTRPINNSGMYSSSSARHNPTMSSAFLDRMQVHMNNTNHNDLASYQSDQMKLSNGVHHMRSSQADKFNIGLPNNNTTYGSIGRYSPCTISSPLTGMFSNEQDWVDLSDMALPSGGNHMLAA